MKKVGKTTRPFRYAAATAKSLQSCLTLCDPVDGSPPGSPSLGFSRQEYWSGVPDLNQIPYDYTVEVTNRFKGLDLIDRVPEKLWTEVCDIVQEAGIKTIPKKNKCKKGKMVV